MPVTESVVKFDTEWNTKKKCNCLFSAFIKALKHESKIKPYSTKQTKPIMKNGEINVNDAAHTLPPRCCACVCVRQCVYSYLKEPAHGAINTAAVYSKECKRFVQR